MGISAIGQTAGEYIAKGIGKVTKTDTVRKICENFKNDPIKYAGYATLASLATKDAVGCYLYVTQSLNNKKIPEDKRRFVANMDLTNGILNVITQIGLTFGLKKLYQPAFNKMLKKSFNEEACKTLVSKIRQDAKASGNPIMRKLEAYKKLDRTKKDIYSAFSAVLDIFVATIIAKRCIVPFLSTPITQYFTNQHEKKMEAKKAAEGKNNQPEAKTEEKPAGENKTEQVAEAKPEPTFSNGTSTNLLDKYRK